MLYNYVKLIICVKIELLMYALTAINSNGGLRNPKKESIKYTKMVIELPLSWF